jgi:hypothetical protein
MPVIGLDAYAGGHESLELYFPEIPPDSCSDFERLLLSRGFSQNAFYDDVLGILRRQRRSP